MDRITVKCLKNAFLFYFKTIFLLNKISFVFKQRNIFCYRYNKFEASLVEVFTREVARGSQKLVKLFRCE